MIAVQSGPFVHLRSAGVSVLFDGTGPGQPVLVHWGADLGELSDVDCAAITLALSPAVPHSGLDRPARPGLLPERALGYRGRPGVAGHRAGADFAPVMTLISTSILESGVQFSCADDSAGLAVETIWRLPAAGILEVYHELTNTGSSPYSLAELAAVLPVPLQAGELVDFTGRWCRERSPQRRSFQFGAWTRENRRGRTGFDSAFLSMAGTPGFSNRTGQVWAVHLGWSGDQVYWAEAQPDGTRVLGAAELLAPGECELRPGGVYVSPPVYAAFSDSGLDGIGRRFHSLLRARPTHPSTPRPAVLNTWEAVYFDHDLDRLTRLADTAAAAGIERFVLDDGWFGGRRTDETSLGDWTVSADLWPDGLGPLVDHVRGAGMQFGLWVEPEMINVDSDLYRAHPDWVLAPADRLPPEWRHQQVLDVARPEVFDYLFGHLDALVKQYRIDYLKWDHNRDVVAATHDHRAGVHAQTQAVYRLLDALRGANPGLEIESCASGGARIDLGILAHTDRVWASDCNDALERQHIQRWTGLLLPPELIGTHVGPPTAHTTGRTHDLDFRAATALFGHFGVEWDIASATDEDRAALASVVTHYRRLRPLLHSGVVVNTDHPDPSATLSGVVAVDLSAAVFRYTQLTTSALEKPTPAVFAGLAPEKTYRVSVLEVGGPLHVIQRKMPAWVSAGGVSLSGRALQTTGLALPVLEPEHVLILELRAPTTG